MSNHFFVRRVFLLLGMIFLFPGLSSGLEQAKNMATLGLETEYHRYKEDFMKETGFLSGLNGAYTYHGKIVSENLPNGMFKLEGRIIFGHVNYDGQLFDGRHYEIKSVRDFTGEIRGLGGYDFSIFSDTTITPFTGIGYRYLSDDLSKDNAGYRRHSNYIYSPVGVQTMTPLSNGWSAGVSAEYDIFWHGWQDTYLSDLDPKFSDMTNDQHHGYGFKTSLQVRKAMEDKNWIFEPYVHYWDIKNSVFQEAKYAGAGTGEFFFEPKNSTLEIGMKVGVEF